MEHTNVHPLLALVEDNQNGLKLLLKNYIDFTVEQQFDYFKNRILKMMENGLIDPLYEDTENDNTNFRWKDEQITLPTTPLTNSIYTEPVVRKGFDDFGGEDENDELQENDIMNCGNLINGIGNSAYAKFENASGDDSDTEVNEDEYCETQPNASLENNQINSPIAPEDDQEDVNDSDEITVNTNNLQESDLQIRTSKSANKANSINKAKMMSKRGTRQSTRSDTKMKNSKESIASSSGLHSSGRKRIPTKASGKSNSDSKNRTSVKRASDESNKILKKKVKLQNVVNEDETDDDDGIDQLKCQAVILELHCIEPDCCQILTSRSSWAKHMKNVHQKNTKDRYYHLDRNVRLNHCNQPEYFCTYPNCDSVYKSKNTLRIHWRTYHQPGKYKCPSCCFVENLFYKVLNHRYASHGSHECTYPDCKKVFLTNFHLKRHEHVHIDESQYECIYESCGLRYKFVRDAVRHVRLQHFNLPRRIKDQREKNIIDSRDPHEYVRNNLECENVDV